MVGNISIWVYVEDIGSSKIFDCRNTKFVISTDGTLVEAKMANYAAIDYTSTSANNWHHIVLAADGTNHTMYRV